MKKLFAQIVKFGVVGVICFFIDLGIYTALNFLFRGTGFDGVFPQYYLLSQFVSFVLSTFVNYALSMRYVFVRREDISRRREFIIFFILSVIGLGVNELLLWLGMDVIYAHWQWLRSWMSVSLAETFWKLAATAIVMVYNFVTRKIFLEKKEDGKGQNADGQ